MAEKTSWLQQEISKKSKKSRTKSLKGKIVQVQKPINSKVLLSDFVLTNTVKHHSSAIIQLLDTVEYHENIITGLISHLRSSHLSDLMDFQKNVFYDKGKSVSDISSGTANRKTI